MLDLTSPERRHSTAWTRRQALRAGFLGLGSLTLADLLRLRSQAAAPPPTDTAVILVFLAGGPSHLETYDLKPNAPDEIRGPFRPIPTSIPGIEVCEHLPLHARLAHRFSLIRSCTHGDASHQHGVSRMMSGYTLPKPTSTFGEGTYPEMGAVVTRAFRDQRRGLPPAVVMGANMTANYVPGNDPGYLGEAYRPPRVDKGIQGATLRTGRARLDERLELLGGFDAARREFDAHGTMAVMDGFNRQAVDILLSDQARTAFDLGRESPKLRDRYGPAGQQLLLARRLVEAGISFVTVSGFGGGPGTKAFNWDDHEVNWDLPTAMRARLPRYDQALTALIDDIFARGLDRKVLVISMGEFGRTPKIRTVNSLNGRDHWPHAMSILVSGGGMTMGQVVGATNAWGERPKERPLDPHDILATVYKHLGIDHRQEFLDSSGRPIPLARGTPISELW
jgi:hypothetical protein